MQSKSKKALIGVGMLALASAALFGTASAASTPTQTTNTPIRQHDARHQAIDAAISANDYSAFKAAVANAPRPPNAPEITEAVFAKLVEAKKLHDAGDHVSAQAIMESIGFKGRSHGPHGTMMTPPNLTDTQKAAWEQARTLHKAGKHTEARAVLDAAGIKPPTKSSTTTQ